VPRLETPQASRVYHHDKRARHCWMVHCRLRSQDELTEPAAWGPPSGSQLLWCSGLRYSPYASAPRLPLGRPDKELPIQRANQGTSTGTRTRDTRFSDSVSVSWRKTDQGQGQASWMTEEVEQRARDHPDPHHPMRRYQSDPYPGSAMTTQAQRQHAAVHFQQDAETLASPTCPVQQRSHLLVM